MKPGQELRETARKVTNKIVPFTYRKPNSMKGLVADPPYLLSSA